ncbi:MAG: hypothetical protein AVDCRST_MAG58-3700 [uncultured Rubrobacteraceae bacterium]|uniref:Uncharacterized protein n=1 Tax=uncultured Rubrobacteraceae bacterium TaxID=349277 RepID=A0A6J4RFY0_9ACTN|nr:MAG: hypothetical protein AVDCRST_MAG58-3700 [uncultured Rubrobacteraceae bacterium]
MELAEFERKRKELQRRTDALLAQERQLEASARERTELARIADSIEEFCEQVRAGLADATFEQKRRLVELLIDRVTVDDEEVEIRYVLPTSPEGPHQPFCHLRTDYLDGLPGREVVRKQAPLTGNHSLGGRRRRLGSHEDRGSWAVHDPFGGSGM